MAIYKDGKLHMIDGICIETIIESYIPRFTVDHMLAATDLTVVQLKQAIEYAEENLPESYEPWKKEVQEFKKDLILYEQKDWPRFNRSS
jgi:hypothetical protein